METPFVKSKEAEKDSARATAQALVAWYRQGHRDLPWRKTDDAYAIWLSEIMLQQTQVATVLPYYKRFLEAFPTLQDLANAPLDSVLKAWEGLGYYARARNLQKAAINIVSHHQGVFPNTFDSVLALPGIGQSTAGAILTFAYKLPHPILDGNVKRVLSRLMGIQTSLVDKTIMTSLWKQSEKLLPDNAQDAYDFNQALMELGATLCTPKKPDCRRCPWKETCEANRLGLQDRIPFKEVIKVTPHYTIGVGVVRDDEDRILIALRPAEGLLGGLWEFPGGKCNIDETLPECIARELLEETGLAVQVGQKIAAVKHAYTHFKITLHAYDCTVLSGIAEPKASQALKWVTLDEIDTYAFPKANLRILALMKSQSGRQLTLC